MDPIAYDAKYTVQCNTGYKISGSSTMKCGANGFGQTPSCVGKIHIYLKYIKVSKGLCNYY